ncbi:MAG: biotin/lipoyl-containing protein, partial [Planctomycetota bacterium]
NVVMGERYKMISKEVKDYIKGLYGHPPGIIDDGIKKKAIGAEEPINNRPADSIAPEWNKSVEEVNNLGLLEQPTDENFLSYALFPLIAKGFWQDIADKKDNLYSSIIDDNKQTENGAAKNSLFIELNNQKYAVNVSPSSQNDKKDVLVVDVNGQTYEVKVSHQGEIESTSPERASVQADKQVSVEEPKSVKEEVKIPARQGGQEEKASSQPKANSVTPPDQSQAGASGTETSNFDVTVPMPGKIVDLKIKLGDKVKTGDMLFILEAMKMQNEIDSPCDGIIKDISIKIGDNVDNQTTLIRIGT